jgi:lon-related putative ATP-dependent protease
MDNKELSHRELKNTIDYMMFDFETTEQVPQLTGIVGQERGRAAMRFGLNVNKVGYNIYVAGISGTGKTSYTNSIVREFAKKDTKLYDWCYVYNYEDKYKPKMLRLPVGMGKDFQNDMKSLVQDLKNDIPRVFSGESYQKERAAIIRDIQEKSSDTIEKLNNLAKEYGFIIRQSGSGFKSIPLIDGEPINEAQYNKLSTEQLKEIETKSAMLQQKSIEITNEIRIIEKEAKKTLENLDSKIALASVGFYIDELKGKYVKCVEIIKYLEETKKDILNNIGDFKEQTEEENANPLSFLKEQKSDDFINKYRVNLFVDNSETIGAPVVIADNPTYYNLIGKVEYENKMGVLSTDFTKIKPGYLHQANGGYIIIQSLDILSNNNNWEALKRAIKNHKLNIENIGEQMGLVATSSIKPEPIPLDIKVILIGSSDIYQLLYNYDEDFRKLFKIKADFDIEMDSNIENISRLASFIRTRCEEDNLRNFDRSAVAKIVEYSTRLAGHQKKLSTRFNHIVEILYEADAWAELMGEDIVNAKHIDRAINEKNYRSNLYEIKLQESIDEGSILIDTQGEKIGQVNGLAVYQSGQYSFGKPSRITATTYVGQKGIINIERESKMSGNIHNKGVYILGGYLGDKFAQEQPLSLSANLAFEQSYGGVDGDSASSTELYALLSSLAEVPINQGLAVTGSINQKGEIQPIGGVNEKIEGFFDVCKSKKLTGDQGVLIPHQNVKNLMLKDEVIEAVRNGQFHIYQVKTVEEGIELLTGMKAEHKNEKGEYEGDSIYRRVAEKLKGFMESTKNLND